MSYKKTVNRFVCPSCGSFCRMLRIDTRSDTEKEEQRQERINNMKVNIAIAKQELHSLQHPRDENGRYKSRA